MPFIVLSSDSFFEVGVRCLFNSELIDCIDRRTIIIIDLKYLSKIKIDVLFDDVITIIFVMDNIGDKNLLDRELISHLSTVYSIHFLCRNATQSVYKKVIAVINKGKVDPTFRILPPVKRSLLTSKESHVLMLLLQGYNLFCIAEMSTLSTKTISAHKRSIMKKINVKNIPKLFEKIVFKNNADNLLLELTRAKLAYVQRNDLMMAVQFPSCGTSLAPLNNKTQMF